MDGIPSPDEIRKKLAPLFEEVGLQLVLIFGSAVSGALHRESDIDLAFLFDRPIDILGLTNRVIRLLHSDRVDVVDLRRAGALLTFSVAKTGKVLYEGSGGAYYQFCSLAFRKYLDSKKMRDARSEGIRKFLEHRGLL